MLRIIIDTNTLLSGLFFRGNERKIVECFLLGKIDFILPEHVAIESRAVIARKGKKLGDVESALQILDLIFSRATILTIKEYAGNIEAAKKRIRDEKDAPILAAILSAKHDYFVTGDKDFSAAGIGTQITARELLAMI